MASGWEHFAACVHCGDTIRFEDFSPPQRCPGCTGELEWDWYDDVDGRGPSYYTLLPGEIRKAREAANG